MSIVKIQKVKDLKAVVNYSLQDYKTNDDLVTTFECEPATIERDFMSVLHDYNSKNNSNKDMSSRMIIQSFDSDDNLTPEQAHQYGNEFANNYLKNEHQYIVITHTETDNVHNHIIFNDIKYEDLKMFDTKRQHSLLDLRRENDKVSAEHGLTIIEGEKNKYINFNEYVARSKKTSFKEKIENVIDKAIENSSSFEDFLKLMEQQGYEANQGKYLSFKNPETDKSIRTKTLGINYLESSIKYRIENKDYVPIKTKIINKKWIDKSQEKFKNNVGLRKWASKQNINYLNELSNKLYKEGKTLNELTETQMIKENLIESFNNQLNTIDNDIHKFEKMRDCFTVYEKSYGLIQEYKKAENKAEFKKSNYQEFKQYDTAKKNMNFLKKHHSIESKAELEYKLSVMKSDRDLLYGSLGKSINQQRDLDKEKVKGKEKTQEDNR